MFKRVFLTSLAVSGALLLSSCALWSGVNEDFSGKDWQLKEAGPNAQVTYSENGLTLRNSYKDNGYCAVYKDFEVDLDLTPHFSITLTGEEANGRVRIQLPGKKREDMFLFRHNGVYTVNVAEKLKVSGPQKLRVYIYVEQINRAVTAKKISFTMDKPEPKIILPPARKSRVVPSYNSASFYLSMPEVKNLKVVYRKLPAGKWQTAYAPIRDNDAGNYRGSIVNLEESSDYILRALVDNKVWYSKPFRTWNSHKAVGRTIVLDKNNFKGELNKIISGKPYAWVRYTCAPNFTLTNDGKTPLIVADKVKYVIFDGLKLKGGRRNAVIISNSSNVIIRNCDISGWGRPGVQRLDLDGKYYCGEQKNQVVNFDGAIDISESRNVTVERCFIHDPLTRANSWQFSHPAGPEAITIYNCRSTVIRHNDFVGSDEHRWNDAVEGRGNGSKIGGINSDADVYGNFMIFASDDCIELDGGQHNIRCFGNRIEGSYSGISIQGCMRGPSYVFDNWINDLGDEYGLSGQSLKTSSRASGKYAKSFIFNNTFSGRGNGTSSIKHLPMEIYNNVFTGSTKLTIGKHPCVNDHNLVQKADKKHGKNTIVRTAPGFAAPERGNYAPAKNSIMHGKAKKLDGFTRGNTLGAMQSNSCYEQLPRRPIPVKLDAATLTFARNESEKSFTATVQSDEEFRKEFSIVKTDVADWIEVTPSKGILQTGQSITFNVKLNRRKMRGRRNWRGAFLIRFADGLSRPVAVYASGVGSDAKAEAKKLNAFVTFVEAENPVNANTYPVIDHPQANGKKAVNFNKLNPSAPPKDPKQVNCYEFSVPKDGYYTIALRMRADGDYGMHDTFYASIDSEKLAKHTLAQHIGNEWAWCVPSGLKKNPLMSGSFAYCYLKKGKHTFRIAPREQLYFDTLGVTDNSEIFINW